MSTNTTSDDTKTEYPAFPHIARLFRDVVWFAPAIVIVGYLLMVTVSYAALAIISGLLYG